MFFCLVFVMPLCASVYLWSPAGKGLTSWLSFVAYNCEFVTFPLISWVRCGTCLYRFLIFAPLLTLTNPDVNRKRVHQLLCYMTLSPFSYLFLKSICVVINLLKSDVPSAPTTRLFQKLLFKFLVLLWDAQKNCSRLDLAQTIYSYLSALKMLMCTCPGLNLAHHC